MYMSFELSILISIILCVIAILALFSFKKHKENWRFKVVFWMILFGAFLFATLKFIETEFAFSKLEEFFRHGFILYIFAFSEWIWYVVFYSERTGRIPKSKGAEKVIMYASPFLIATFCVLYIILIIIKT